MRLLSLLRTQAFRIVLIYVVMFAVSVSAIVAFTYWNTARALNFETDQIVDAETTGLAEQYQRQGLRGLNDVIIGRSVRGGQGLYLLTDVLHRPIAGNLDYWPPAIKGHPGGFVDFSYPLRAGGGSETHFARGKVFTLVGGFQLLVARDVHERYIVQRLFTTTLPWTVGLMLLVGLVGGAWLSRNMLARLDTINRTSREIMAGDFSRRVPVHQAKDEFDTLSANLNLMLDRIERLMHGMREVTDSVAHDLRTPLNRLRNRLEALQRRYADDPTAHEVDAAIAETDHLIATFNALLLIAEADAGTVREAMTMVDLSQVAEDVAELYGPLAEEKGVALTLQKRGIVQVEGNRRLISQAAANLLDNAIKYTPSGGGVSLTAAETPNGAEFRVADTGPGIAENDRTRVVERFVRLEESRNSPGTGLGLSLVAAVARMHNALLLLEDNHPGLRAVLRFSRLRLGAPRTALAE